MVKDDGEADEIFGGNYYRTTKIFPIEGSNSRIGNTVASKIVLRKGKHAAARVRVFIYTLTNRYQVNYTRLKNETRRSFRSEFGPCIL